jgi:hypothetical protein
VNGLATEIEGVAKAVVVNGMIWIGYKEVFNY